MATRRSAGKYIRPRPDLVAAFLLVLCVVLVFGWRAHHGIWFTTFGDEGNHLVGAKAISGGYRLYKDFVDEHGPLIYALPQVYGAVFGWNALNNVRMVPVFLLALTTLSLVFSPIFSDAWERAMVAALFVGLMTTVWLVQGLFLLDYQPVAGMVLMTGLAQFTLPAWLGAQVRPASAVLAGAMFALTPFLAFTYGPASVLFALWGIWAWLAERPWFRLAYFALGAVAGLAGILVWMIIFADFRGYVAYHFIEGIRFQSAYENLERVPALTVLLPSFADWDVVQSLGVAAAIVAMAGLIAARMRERPRRWFVPVSFALGCLGVVLTNPRGSPLFQDGAFIVVSFGLAAIALTRLVRPRVPQMGSARRLGLVAAAFVMISTVEEAAHFAVTSPHGFTRAELPDAQTGLLSQSDISWAKQVRRVTDPDEPTLALPFNPNFYLLVGRLPMQGYYIYLPWDADFGKQPVLGLRHDICQDLPKSPPPVIYYDGAIIGHKYDPAHYMPCVLSLIARSYQKMPGEPYFYVRSDRVGRLDHS